MTAFPRHLFQRWFDFLHNTPEPTTLERFEGLSKDEDWDLSGLIPRKVRLRSVLRYEGAKERQERITPTTHQTYGTWRQWIADLNRTTKEAGEASSKPTGVLRLM